MRLKQLCRNSEFLEKNTKIIIIWNLNATLIVAKVFFNVKKTVKFRHVYPFLVSATEYYTPYVSAILLAD